VFNMTHTQIITMSPSQFVYLCASVHWKKFMQLHILVL
jgi:hypothetical protein